MTIIDGNSLTIEDVNDVAINGQKAALPTDKKFWERMEKSRKFLLDYISTGVPTYGVTTDFGDSCYKQISVDKAGRIAAHNRGLPRNRLGSIL